MTHKHFDAIAAALKNCKPDARSFPTETTYKAALAQWTRTVSEIRQMCVMQNANFNGNKFLDACGFDD